MEERLRQLLFFNSESLQLFLQFLPVERLETEDRSVYVEGRHDAAAAVGGLHYAGLPGGFFYVDLLVKDSFVVEKLLGLIAVRAPAGRVDFDVRHLITSTASGPFSLNLGRTQRFYYEETGLETLVKVSGVF
jgi:hypothetical protein